MGETQRLEIHFSDASIQALHDAFAAGRAAERRATEPVPAGDEPKALTPYDLGLMPWTLHDPQLRCDVVAYVDDREQVRHVPTTRATEVPASWRRVWLQPRD
jgi:hypothetical protein